MGTANIQPELPKNMDILARFSAFKLGKISEGVLSVIDLTFETLSPEHIAGKITDLCDKDGQFLMKCTQENGRWKVKLDRGQMDQLKDCQAIKFADKDISEDVDIETAEEELAIEINALVQTIIPEEEIASPPEQIEEEEEEEIHAETKSAPPHHRTEQQEVETLEKTADARESTAALREKTLEESDEAAEQLQQDKKDAAEATEKAKQRDTRFQKKAERIRRRTQEDTEAPPTTPKPKRKR